MIPRGKQNTTTNNKWVIIYGFQESNPNKLAKFTYTKKLIKLRHYLRNIYLHRMKLGVPKKQLIS